MVNDQKNILLECIYSCRSPKLVLLSYSEDRQYMITTLRTIAAGFLLHTIQEEGEQEVDSEGRVPPTPFSLALLYILTSLRSIPSSCIKAHHAEKHPFLLQQSRKVRCQWTPYCKAGFARLPVVRLSCTFTSKTEKPLQFPSARSLPGGITHPQ